MLGLRFSRLVHASLAGGSLALMGCVDRAYDFGDSGEVIDPTDDPDPTDPSGDPPDPTGQPPEPDPNPMPPPPPSEPGPPRLLDVRFIDAATLELTFSEGMAPTDEVNPRQFRLSAAISPEPGYGYGGTFYQEVGMWNGGEYYCEEYCYEQCVPDGCYERCFEYCSTPPGPPVVVEAITPTDRPQVLLLSLSDPISGGVCQELDNLPSDWTAELYIHYTVQGSALVADLDGEAFEDLGAHWVLDFGNEYSYVEGYLPYMSPELAIPCPF